MKALETLLMLVLTFWSATVLACPANLVDPNAVAAGEPVSMELADASHSARPGPLMGASCLHSTGLMAKRVVDEGISWSYEGGLLPTSSLLDATVSCPFSTENGTFQVVATELLDAIVSCGYSTQRLLLEGRSLEVDGVRYVVITSFRLSK
jgi:hypothetical protein